MGGQTRGRTASGEMEIWTSSLVVFRKMPLESSRVRAPEPSHVTVTSQLPSGQVSWGLPGRWLPCPILFALALPQPLECISWCLPGRPICWPHLSWRALPRAPLLVPDTWHLRGTSGTACLCVASLSGKSTGLEASTSYTPGPL